MLREHTLKAKKDGFAFKDDLPGMDVISFKVKEDCILHGRTLKEIDLRNLHDVTILAIHRNGEMIEIPAGNTILNSGDVLIVLGKPERLCRLKKFMEKGNISADCPCEQSKT
jgi:CPA2 family monovalent cation:H+ antiporter-2